MAYDSEGTIKTYDLGQCPNQTITYGPCGACTTVQPCTGVCSDFYKLAEIKANVLHKKCPIIKLVKDQINRVQRNDENHRENGAVALRDDKNRKRKKCKDGTCKNVTKVLCILLLVCLIWLLIIYAALLGGALCSGSCNNKYTSYRGCGSGWVVRLPGVAWSRPAQYIF